MNKYASLILVAFLIVSCFPILNFQKVKAQAYNYGVNLRSVNWSYSESDAVWNVDFANLENQSIRLFCFQLQWYLVEPTQGVYGDAFLDRIINVAEIAETYDIDVIVDFHSGSGTSKTYGLPTWVTDDGKDFDDVATNSTYKGYYLDMLNYTITYLDGLTNVHSYHIFNEPDTRDEHDSYLILFQDAYDVADLATTRSVTMRMGPFMMFTDGWDEDATFWGIWDYGPTLNIYLGLYAYHTVFYLQSYVSLCSTYGKSAMISEYGWDSDNDETQRSHVETQIEYFMNLGIQYTLLEIFGPTNASNDFNVRNDDASLRPAFYELYAANGYVEPSPEPPPPPPPENPPPEPPEFLGAASYPTNAPFLEGSRFQIYADAGGFCFDSSDNKTLTIEVLAGTWNGTECVLGITGRGGNLYFYSNNLAYVQLTNGYEDFNIRLQYEGIALSSLSADSWNGTIPADTEVYIRWSWGFLMPHEENFLFYIGVLGLILLLFGIMLIVYCFRHYAIMTLNPDKELVWEKDALMVGVCVTIIGFGLLVMWLMS